MDGRRGIGVLNINKVKGMNSIYPADGFQYFLLRAEVNASLKNKETIGQHNYLFREWVKQEKPSKLIEFILKKRKLTW